MNNKLHWLIELRKNKGLTQEEVSKSANITRSFYTHIENSNRKPSVNVAKKIGEELGFDWTIFFESDVAKENIS